MVTLPRVLLEDEVIGWRDVIGPFEQTIEIVIWTPPLGALLTGSFGGGAGTHQQLYGQCGGVSSLAQSRVEPGRTGLLSLGLVLA